MPPEDRLQEYRAKRDPTTTPEPFGQGEESPSPSRVFVVQQHDARSLHWDLRLEMEGVLRSWAVPKGPSLDPSVRRLAIRTEDHPLEYADFEGVIPEGSYGAGAMIVWDRGRWTPLPVSAKEEEKGKLLFELHGRKLRGRWTLFPTSDDGKQWLLIKKEDAWSRPEEESTPPETSILSGLSVRELAEGASHRDEIVAELEALGATRRPVELDSVEPMLAETAEGPFSREGWWFELKYDGYRLLAARRGSRPELRYRRGGEVTRIYPEIVRALLALPYEELILDGEVVVLEPDGRPSFQRLQRRAQLSRRLDIERGTLDHPVTLYAFDLLAFAGYDLRDLPLRERKRPLRRILPGLGVVRYADEVEERGEALFRQVRDTELEGVMAKDASSRYRPGRSDRWLKIRADEAEEVVIVGHRPPKGETSGIGALHVAQWQGGELVPVGRVGSGLDAAIRRELEVALAPLKQESPPLELPEGQVRDQDTWVAPRRRARVRYTEKTDDGRLRHPVFLELLEETVPRVSRHAVEAAESQDRSGAKSRFGAKSGSGTGSEPGPVEITNRDKPFWPDDGFTKGDLVDYYDRIAPWLLPYLRSRPLVLARYPDGIAGKSFYQKQAPAHLPDWIETVEIRSGSPPKAIDYIVCNDRETLLHLVNLGTIPFHLWASPVDRLDRPDWCIVDLDPKEAPFEDVVVLARTLSEICREIRVPAFVKTSGATGLHVLVPLGGQLDYEQSRTFAELLARLTLDRHRKIATLARSLQARSGRVYLDYLQNRRGQLLVAPYAVRALPGAPVSTPLRWKEVVPSLAVGRFTIRSVPRRMAQLQEDPLAPVLTAEPDLLAGLERLSEALS
ncbi:MAG: DNA ligase D [Thermoanaerobaculia bacterium]|nr:DNA ligase D [Thermoanaerobaculia bacterium]